MLASVTAGLEATGAARVVGGSGSILPARRGGTSSIIYALGVTLLFGPSDASAAGPAVLLMRDAGAVGVGFVSSEAGGERGASKLLAASAGGFVGPSGYGAVVTGIA